MGETVSVPGRLSVGVLCAPRGSGSGAGGRGGRMQSPPRPRGHTDGLDIPPDIRSSGGSQRGGAWGEGPGSQPAPGRAGSRRGGWSPDSPPQEAQGTVLCALSPWPARRSSAGVVLWDPLSTSQLEAQQCAWETFHIRVQHRTVGRREGRGWRGSSQTCGPLRSALRAVTHEGSPRTS